jgi:uncharacterized protein with HEPN domain
MYRRDDVLINDICDAINESLDIVRDISYHDFEEDRVRQYAIVRLLEIIGEAGNQISVDFKDKNPDIPWRKMIAMRNRLIHGYFSINTKIVWDTVHVDLLNLKKKLDCEIRKV